MWEAPWHWVVLGIVVIALFGYKKLPDASRSLGRSLRIFKTELKGLTEDDQAREQAAGDGAGQSGVGLSKDGESADGSAKVPGGTDTAEPPAGS